MDFFGSVYGYISLFLAFNGDWTGPSFRWRLGCQAMDAIDAMGCVISTLILLVALRAHLAGFSFLVVALVLLYLRTEVMIPTILRHRLPTSVLNVSAPLIPLALCRTTHKLLCNALLPGGDAVYVAFPRKRSRPVRPTLRAVGRFWAILGHGEWGTWGQPGNLWRQCQC